MTQQQGTKQQALGTWASILWHKPRLLSTYWISFILFDEGSPEDEMTFFYMTQEECKPGYKESDEWTIIELLPDMPSPITWPEQVVSRIQTEILESKYLCKSAIVLQLVGQLLALTKYAQSSWAGESIIRQVSNRDRIEVKSAYNELTPIIEYFLHGTSILTIINNVIYVNDGYFSFSGSNTTRNRKVCLTKRLFQSDLYTRIESYEQIPTAYRR